MITPKNICQKGFTLLELFVVLTIISILAALIVPACSYGHLHGIQANCSSRAMAIAVTIASYSTTWDGWTNPDSTAFIVDIGYRLSTETGYFGEPPGWYFPNSNHPTDSQKFALAINDLRCPVDLAPARNVHGIPCSYQVSPFFAGGNVRFLGDCQAENLVVVGEIGQRHESRGGDYEGNYVFADLHVELGLSPGGRAGIGRTFYRYMK